MDNRQRPGPAKPIAIILLAGMALLTWIIQLARAGDPVGYITLTVLIMLVTLLVVGLVVALLMLVFGRWVNRSRSDDDWLAARQSQRLMMTQIQDLQNVLLQMQRHPELAQIMAQARQNPALLMSGSEWAQPAAAPTLSPGQMMTADGFVVDGSRFTALDAADADEHTQNGDF